MLPVSFSSFKPASAKDSLPETSLPLSRLNFLAAIVYHKLFESMVSALYGIRVKGVKYLPVKPLPDYIFKSLWISFTRIIVSLICLQGTTLNKIIFAHVNSDVFMTAGYLSSLPL